MILKLEKDSGMECMDASTCKMLIFSACLGLW